MFYLYIPRLILIFPLKFVSGLIMIRGELSNHNISDSGGSTMDQLKVHFLLVKELKDN